ncbi:hypothetical protein M8J77_015497 [Diaphorina citri]|nr:hypothetical protein M8J77_015497 [Diaphorina citri]
MVPKINQLGFTVLLLAVFGQPSNQGFFCSDTSIRYPFKESTVSTGLLACISLSLPNIIGFFCSDTSIRYPFKESTVSTGLLACISLSLPNIIIFVCELCKILYGQNTSKVASTKAGPNKPPGRYVFLILLIKSFGTISLFWLGIGFAQITVHGAKFLCGRLRPHFFEICRPNIDCSLEQYRYAFVTNYTCLGTDLNLIRSARASFPSAHSAVAFYAAVYTIIYLHRVRITIRGSRFPGYFLQFIIFQAAWYTSLTRVLDNMHHWTDVLAGALIGITFALLIINYVEPPRPRLDPEIIEELRRANALPAELWTSSDEETQQSAVVSDLENGISALARVDRSVVNV